MVEVKNDDFIVVQKLCCARQWTKLLIQNVYIRFSNDHSEHRDRDFVASL